MTKSLSDSGSGKTRLSNTLKEAFHQLDVPSDDDASPVQFSRCPACGEALYIKTCFRRFADEKLLEVPCAIRTCIFHDHLPLYVVDEEIRPRRPTLVVGTVDKFARMPWLEETKALYSGLWNPAVDSTDTRPGQLVVFAGPLAPWFLWAGASLPPALVIQDELHLISGPLGTMVGVYEAAYRLPLSAGGPSAPRGRLLRHRPQCR